MSVVVTGDYRGKVVDITNDCQNPSFENDVAGWAYTYFGPNGAGTFGRIQVAYAVSGSYVCEMKWTQFTTNPYTSGFHYVIGWNANASRWIHAQMLSPQKSNTAEIRITFFDVNNNQIGAIVRSPYIALANNAWTIMEGLFTSPANTHHAWIDFTLSDIAGGMNAGDQLLLDQVGMTYATAFVPWFDGSSAAGADGYTYSWAGTAGSSTSNRNKNDPTTGIVPELALPYDVGQPSRNVVIQLIDGPVVAAVYPAGLRTGNLRLFFLTAAAAASARAAFARAGTWTYVDSDNPDETLLFVIAGTVQKTQSTNAKRWTVTVPFQEVTP